MFPDTSRAGAMLVVLVLNFVSKKLKTIKILLDYCISAQTIKKQTKNQKEPKKQPNKQKTKKPYMLYWSSSRREHRENTATVVIRYFSCCSLTVSVACCSGSST